MLGEGLRDPAIVKLSSCIHWAVVVQNCSSRGHSLFRHWGRGDQPICCLLPQREARWSVRGALWIHPLAWALIAWKDGPASPSLLALSPSSLPVLHSPEMIFLGTDSDPITSLPPLQSKSRLWRLCNSHPCFSFQPNFLSRPYTLIRLRMRAHLILLVSPLCPQCLAR